MEKYKNCQSCSMPLSKDEQGGGTEIDGTKSSMYCSHCYRDGAFVEPNLTVIQMQEEVKNHIKSMGFPLSWFAAIFASSVPKLARWQKK